MESGASERLHILLPYQLRWVQDASPLKLWLAARQVGKSFAVAMEAVAEAVRRKCTNLLLSTSERQSRELMRKVYVHLRFLNVRSLDIVRAERSTQEEVALPNGSRIISLPANPDTVRGFSGNVFLDEFAFHTDAREIWRAMYPTVTRGYKVRVTSTPNGKQNMFYELWDRDGRFSKHRTDIYDAVGEGLNVDVEALRKGIVDRASWEQEFQCRFLDEATAYITYEMIAACEDGAAATELQIASPPVRNDNGESARNDVIARSRATKQSLDLYLGVDVGRHKDLTVFWLLEKIGDVFWTRMVKELSREPFSVQRDCLYALLDGQALGGGRVRRCCIDSSGLGMQLAEEARERYGSRVEPVAFTAPVKEDLALTVRRKFEERQLRIPADPRIREDIHSVRRTTTAAGNVRFNAAGSGDSHADRFWALALALHASGEDAGPVLYEPIGRREFDLRGCF